MSIFLLLAAWLCIQIHLTRFRKSRSNSLSIRLVNNLTFVLKAKAVLIFKIKAYNSDQYNVLNRFTFCGQIFKTQRSFSVVSRPCEILYCGIAVLRSKEESVLGDCVKTDVSSTTERLFLNPVHVKGILNMLSK